MKKTLLFIIFTAVLLPVHAQYTAIPDANFEQELIDQMIDTDETVNGQVLTADISGHTILDVSGQNIADLSGIEDFTALENLNCSNNQLTILNITQNINVTQLTCSDNQLRNLLVNGLNVLTTFDATANPDLVCIQVDDIIAADDGIGIYATWLKDGMASYAENCTNAALGVGSSFNNTSGNFNTFIGNESGYGNISGNRNTYLGAGSGFSNSNGSGNVFLGFNAGYYETGSNLLYIDNSDTDTPLIWGDFANDLLGINAAVRIGNVPMPDPGEGYNLYVEIGILAERVKVAASDDGTNWADYVFEKGYWLRPLEELEDFITKNKHLPGIPSAEEVVKEGIDLARMDAKLLEKIEELVLYTIKQHKTLKQQQKQLEELQQQNNQFLKRIETLENQ